MNPNPPKFPIFKPKVEPTTETPAAKIEVSLPHIEQLEEIAEIEQGLNHLAQSLSRKELLAFIRNKDGFLGNVLVKAALNKAANQIL